MHVPGLPVTPLTFILPPTPSARYGHLAFGSVRTPPLWFPKRLALRSSSFGLACLRKPSAREAAKFFLRPHGGDVFILLTPGPSNSRVHKPNHWHCVPTRWYGLVIAAPRRSFEFPTKSWCTRFLREVNHWQSESETAGRNERGFSMGSLLKRPSQVVLCLTPYQVLQVSIKGIQMLWVLTSQ